VAVRAGRLKLGFTIIINPDGSDQAFLVGATSLNGVLTALVLGDNFLANVIAGLHKVSACVRGSYGELMPYRYIINRL
jgi:hypothetical protein